MILRPLGSGDGSFRGQCRTPEVQRVSVSLLPANASFAEVIQDCFVAMAGRGLMLSPLDSQLVVEWSRQEIPVEVVVRGLQRAQARLLYDARPGDRPVRSLRACRRDVEAEIRSYLQRSAGAGVIAVGLNPEDETSAKEVTRVPRKLMRALRELASRRPELAKAVDNLCTAAGSLPFERRDPVLLSSLLRALPFQERVAILRDARAARGDEQPASWHARKVSRRFHRLLSTRRALHLPAFW